MEKVVTDYLKLLNFLVSESYCKKRVASHPDYPSLLSVADTLEQLGIPYGAVWSPRLLWGIVMIWIDSFFVQAIDFKNLSLVERNIPITGLNQKQNQKVNTMKDLLNAGHVLGRSEMKKIMAGSGEGCYKCCYDGGGICGDCASVTNPKCPEGTHSHACDKEECVIT